MRKVNLLAISLLMAVSFGASAIIKTSGTVEILYPSKPGLVYFKLKNDSCDTSGYFKFSLSTEEGRAWYALLLAAANTSKPISVAAPQCPTTVDIDILYVYQIFN